MSGLRLLIIAGVCTALVGIVVMSPGLRQRVGGLARGVSEDVGPAPASNRIGSEIKVYVPRGGRFYHGADCARLEPLNAVPMRLSEAKALYEPCPECNPPR